MDRSRPLKIEGLRFRDPATSPEWTVTVSALELSAGEQLLLTGMSGDGRSALLYLISGLLDPNEGRVLIGGTDLQSMRGGARDRYRSRNIGMILPGCSLLHDFSAAENVMAALMFSELPGREHRAYAVDLLARLGIKNPDAVPDTLTIEQRQRVAVARAVACEPMLVLADEPTAGLEPELAHAAVEFVQETCRSRGAALLCSSHEVAIAARFGRRTTLDELRPVPTLSAEVKAHPARSGAAR
jgi:putative ABC transport system ATP-binding protein